ncbi:DUF3563 family protein [Caballeronia grimmiae]|jgi:hypothetical protein|uniref:DUF3563 domain-containing protein n=1 Tax=Caballeronia grimmiae TaxID=1071679 RepID=A0ABQ1RC14_9BURK|nr:DUF3563 family protein [Caballeronia grimmiae]GGD61893.1 hypothetical protein GCM10010985_15040 [Caballeronia grimmiae]
MAQAGSHDQTVNTMIMFLIYLLNAWLDAIERKRCDAYVSEATDLADVERRIRKLEAGDVLP